MVGLTYYENPMKTVTGSEKISRNELAEMAERMFGGLVKAVVDVEKGIMIVDADLHADEEAALIENGSKQDNLWGINLYPEESGEDFIEFDSMINVRPRQNNRSRGVESVELQGKIREIVGKLVV
jgi:hypothetical protein